MPKMNFGHDVLVHRARSPAQLLWPAGNLSGTLSYEMDPHF